MSFLYFAYGSNLLRQRLHLQNPSAKFVAAAELADYKLAFSCLGMKPENLRWKGGAATIQKSIGNSVWGCVWRLGKEHLPTLDRQELVYDALDVKVTTADNTEYTCRTYQLSERDFSDKPSPMYMDVIIRGAVQNRLPNHYIQYLQSIETNEFNDSNLEIYKNIISMLE